MEKEEDAYTLKQDKFNHSFDLISDRRSSLSRNDLTAKDPSKKWENRVFSCNYCTQKFCSAQALGGHQNAHRRERMYMKQRQFHLDAAAALRPHSTAPWLPLHGGPFGMRVLQKPNVGVPMFQQRRFLPQQLTVGNSGGGGPRFDDGWRVPTTADESGSSQLNCGSRHEFKPLDLSLKL